MLGFFPFFNLHRRKLTFLLYSYLILTQTYIIITTPKAQLEKFSSVHFTHSVVSNSLRPHESQHARPPCPSPTPGVHSHSCPSSQWCHPGISSSVIPLSSCPQSLPALEFFPVSQLFAWGGQILTTSQLLWCRLGRVLKNTAHSVSETCSGTQHKDGRFYNKSWSLLVLGPILFTKLPCWFCKWDKHRARW